MLLSTAFALTVAEFVLRRFFPVLYAALPEALEYDDRTGWRPNTALHLFCLADHPVEVQSNVHGTADFQDDFRNYRELVFAVGDSLYG